MTELNVREPNFEDSHRLAEIYNHYIINTHVTFDIKPVSDKSRQKWLSGYNKDPIHRLFVGTVNNKVIGYASSSQFRSKPAYYRSVETTIYLAPEALGKGHGKALYQYLLDQLVDTKVKRCYGVIALPNDASVELHRGLGYREVGHLTDVGFKFDRFWDTLWMERSI